MRQRPFTGNKTSESTRPFAEVWEEVKAEKKFNPGLEAKTLFEEMQRRYPGKFSDGQLRTLQRKFKEWRARAMAEKAGEADDIPAAEDVHDDVKVEV